MPRQARLDAPGTLHHVMIRGIERSPFFKDNQDRQDFISRIRMIAQQTGTKILAWALMSNHVDLLLFSGPPGISKFMRRLLTGYALRYNRRHRRSSHLFQNRQKSIVCQEDSYLMNWFDIFTWTVFGRVWWRDGQTGPVSFGVGIQCSWAMGRGKRSFWNCKNRMFIFIIILKH